MFTEPKRKLCILAALTLLLAATVYALLRTHPVVETVALRDMPYTYVIDAGHGGIDGGAVSPTGLYESHINLQIARKLESLLSFYGCGTVMTRRSDVSLHSDGAGTIRAKKVSDLKNRAALVNATPNALLVSIHQNTFEQTQYFGTQCFYANGAKALAERTQALITQMLSPDNTRQCKQVDDSVYLFSNVTCPAMLVECGFLTNPSDEKNLSSDGYQIKMAACILAALMVGE